MGIIIKAPKIDDIDITISSLKDFYKKNSSYFVKERNPNQLLAAAESEKLFLVVDDEYNEGAEMIRGVGAVFDYGNGVKEIGGIRILDNGFGLQKILMSLAVFMEWAMDPSPVSSQAIAITDKNNTASNINISRSGFTLTANIPEEYAIYTEVDLNKKNYYIFEFNEYLISKAANNLAESYSGKIKRKDRHIDIKIDIPLLNRYKIIPFFLEKFGPI